MKFFLILSLLFYIEASVISDTQLKKKKSQLKIIEEKEKKLIQTITVSKRFINCLNKSKIIPKSIIDEFATQKKIIVTKDYEYIVDPKNAMRNKINNSIKLCVNKEKSNGIRLEFEGESVESSKSDFDSEIFSAENSFDCNITKLVESINANFPKNVKANRISLTVQDNYSELNTYVNNLRTQNEEARDYKFFDILFDANCQSMVGLYISKKEYKRKKEKNTFFDE